VPTVQSIKLAIATYERQGGTAAIFINDDGLQLMDPAQREMRKEFYRVNGIGWVARPAHGKNGFVRAGRFKKASNMNFAMDIAQKLEQRLEEVERTVNWSDHDELEAYQQCLNSVVKEEHTRTGHEPWAAGNISMGEIILIIDSDTRVPVDCFLDAANEFHLSPNVAIIQHNSGVMQVVHDFFENAISKCFLDAMVLTLAYFTQSIYFSLQFATSAGDTAAFVGHNAFLRWSALQEVAWFDDTDGKTKYWSESHVSEDFEMSLKLQTQGYISRYATYSNEAFQEGVSLTCYDEMLRWSKYAYGCSELVFNPFSKWHKRGPFTDIFIHFLRSDLNSFSKFTMIGYIGTYYAIALWPLLTVNYLVMGWYRYFAEQGYAFYNEGFGVFLSVIVVFNILGPITSAVVKYRAKKAPFLRGLYDNFKWSLPLMIFLGGLSMHLSYALIAHLCDLVRPSRSYDAADERIFNGEPRPRQWKKATSSQKCQKSG
jgi:cellulose synthase/poly-beta-1,6-N-acetylglucosamine synthase-like glycosyltransferase